MAVASLRPGEVLGKWRNSCADGGVRFVVEWARMGTQRQEEQQNVRKKARFPFRTKLILICAILVVLPLAVIGPFVFVETKTNMTRLSQEVRVAVAKDIAGSIEDTLSRALDVLDALGQSLTDETIPEEVATQLTLIVVGAQSVIDHAAIYDRNGDLMEVIREPSADSLEIPETLSRLLRVQASELGGSVGQVFLLDQPRVLAVVPVRNRNEVVAYVASFVALATIQERVSALARGHYLDLPDSIFVVDNERRVIAHASGQASAAAADVANHSLLSAVDSATFFEPSGFATSAAYENNGVRMVGTLVAVPQPGWAVVAQVPEAWALSSVYTVQRWLIGTTALAILVALFAAVFMARRVTKPIQQLSKFADDLAHRRFDSRVTIQTSDELALLGQAMSDAAADLQESEFRIAKEVAIRTDLGRYLSADLVEQVVKREQDMALGGARRDITVLFADVVAFTPMTEELAAEEVVTVLNELFTILTEIIFRHEGTVDKFVGDCVMAIWGAPKPQKDHAALAVRAAQDMMKWLEAGNLGWKERHGITIRLAIGLHSGEAVVGNIGSETRMEYTAIGDVVNVAARLEAIARPGQILVTREVREAADQSAEYRDIGARTLSGRAEPVHLFEVTV